MFNRESFARVFDDSGLTKTEIADIYGVSRQTVYAWYSGDSAPLQRTVVAREQLYTRALITALDKRLLPLPRNPVQRKERLLKMRQALHDLAKPKG
jgi:DNA-binding XRE family transcriptional regulator